MLSSVARSPRQRDEGFTLIELMVVVLIIAILIAIAVPTFLGARTRAQDRRIQAGLRNAQIVQKTFYVDSQRYGDDGDAGDLAVLLEIEHTILWNNPNGSLGGVDVDRITAAGEMIVLRSDSPTGTVFCLADVATPLNPTDDGPWYYSGSSCPAGDPPLAPWTEDIRLGW